MSGQERVDTLVLGSVDWIVETESKGHVFYTSVMTNDIPNLLYHKRFMNLVTIHELFNIVNTVYFTSIFRGGVVQLPF